MDEKLRVELDGVGMVRLKDLALEFGKCERGGLG